MPFLPDTGYVYLLAIFFTDVFLLVLWYVFS